MFCCACKFSDLGIGVRRSPTLPSRSEICRDPLNHTGVSIKIQDTHDYYLDERLSLMSRYLFFYISTDDNFEKILNGINN